jgi:hypothetical protein
MEPVIGFKDLWNRLRARYYLTDEQIPRTFYLGQHVTPTIDIDNILGIPTTEADSTANDDEEGNVLLLTVPEGERWDVFTFDLAGTTKTFDGVGLNCGDDLIYITEQVAVNVGYLHTHFNPIISLMAGDKVYAMGASLEAATGFFTYGAFYVKNLT